MITIQLDSDLEQRLKKLAAASGQDTSQFAQRILEMYLDRQAWPKDSEEEWAIASLALAPEVFSEENWDESDPAHGPR